VFDFFGHIHQLEDPDPSVVAGTGAAGASLSLKEHGVVREIELFEQGRLGPDRLLAFVADDPNQTLGQDA